MGRADSYQRPLPPDAVSAGQLRRVLIVKLRNLGDVLLTSPVVSTLKTQWPSLEIDVLVYEDTADMLRGHPGLEQVHVIDRSARQFGALRRLHRECRLITQLHRRKYDLIVHLTDHARSVWLTRLLRPRYSVAPDTRAGKFYKSSFTHLFPVIGGNRRHTVEINLDALRRVGIYPGSTQRRLTLVPGKIAVETVDGLLATQDVGASKFILVHPGSRWFFKCWPPEQVAALCRRLVSGGWEVVLVCGPDSIEKKILDYIVQQTGLDLVSFRGNLSIKELAALISKARLFVGSDSAPMHVAAAMGTPTVALFGPSGEVEWGPWQVPHRVVTSSHPCRPCGRDGCGGGKRSECLETIDVQEVLTAVESLLEETR